MKESEWTKQSTLSNLIFSPFFSFVLSSRSSSSLSDRIAKFHGKFVLVDRRRCCCQWLPLPLCYYFKFDMVWYTKICFYFDHRLSDGIHFVRYLIACFMRVRARMCLWFLEFHNRRRLYQSVCPQQLTREHLVFRWCVCVYYVISLLQHNNHNNDNVYTSYTPVRQPASQSVKLDRQCVSAARARMKWKILFLEGLIRTHISIAASSLRSKPNKFQIRTHRHTWARIPIKCVYEAQQQQRQQQQHIHISIV